MHTLYVLCVRRRISVQNPSGTQALSMSPTHHIQYRTVKVSDTISETSLSDDGTLRDNTRPSSVGSSGARLHTAVHTQSPLVTANTHAARAESFKRMQAIKESLKIKEAQLRGVTGAETFRSVPVSDKNAILKRIQLKSAERSRQLHSSK